tara:strand:- start:137 stop:241 length:105 start_codon:yes stop_codon:yes gene_type:complete
VVVAEVEMQMVILQELQEQLVLVELVESVEIEMA